MRKSATHLIRDIALFLLLLLGADIRILSATTQNPASVIRHDETLQKSVSGGGRHTYQVNLSQGNYLRIQIPETTVHVNVTIIDPGGQQVAALDCQRSRFLSLSMIAKRSGEYQLEVHSLEMDKVRGRYLLRLSWREHSVPRDSTRLAAERAFAEGERLQGEWRKEASIQAIDKYKKSLSYWRALGNTVEQARTLKGISESYHALGQMPKAISSYSRALLLTRDGSDPHLTTEINIGLSYILLFMGNGRRAQDASQRALNLSRTTDDRLNEARSLNLIGETYYFLGAKEKAIGFYRQSLAKARIEEDPSGQAQSLLNIGGAFLDLGEEQKASDHFKEAHALLESLNDFKGLAMVSTNLGHLSSRLGEKQEALRYYRKSAQILQSRGDYLNEAIVSSGIASIYDDLGDRQQSLQHYLETLRLFRAARIRKAEAEALIKVAKLYYSLGEQNKALGYILQAERIGKPLADAWLEAIRVLYAALIYDAMGRKEKALTLYNRARSLNHDCGNQWEEANSLNLLGDIYYGRGDVEKALSFYHEALPINRAAGNRYGEVLTLHNIARVERDRGNLKEARARLEEAIGRVESLRLKVAGQALRTSYVATIYHCYELYINVLMLLDAQNPGQGFVAQAFNVSERSRARSLLDALAEAQTDITQGVDPALLQQHNVLLRQIQNKEKATARLFSGTQTKRQAEASERELSELLIRYQELQTQMRSSSPQYAAIAWPEPTSLVEVQQKFLNSDSMLLEYVVGDQGTYLLAVTQSEVKTYALPPRPEIEALAKRFYDLLEAGFPASRKLDEVAAQLSRVLLGPLATLSKYKRLVIVADGALHYVPFAALPAPGSKGNNDVATPLVVNHEIVYLPSASTLAAIRQYTGTRTPAPKVAAIFADPVFSPTDSRLHRNFSGKQADQTALPRPVPMRRQSGVQEMGLARLPFSLQEAKAIMAAASDGEVLSALGLDASLEAVMHTNLSQFRIVHFATHGIINSSKAELSGIVLSLVDAKGQIQNGFLRLHDIYNLNLSADIVVLSACDTALGKEIHGEGLVGLTRGFMHAGAKQVMASLWKINDVATAELMRRFYDKMLREGLLPSAALREAQVEMWKQPGWRSPYYWAAFVIQGDWE